MKERKTQDYMVKYSEDGSRTSREEVAGNKISEQKEDLMTSFRRGPMPLLGVEGHTTTTACCCYYFLAYFQKMKRRLQRSPACLSVCPSNNLNWLLQLVLSRTYLYIVQRGLQGLH
jgi:hypothetical protein